VFLPPKTLSWVSAPNEKKMKKQEKEREGGREGGRERDRMRKNLRPLQAAGLYWVEET
jgi:hypothetical protein